MYLYKALYFILIDVKHVLFVKVFSANYLYSEHETILCNIIKIDTPHLLQCRYMQSTPVL